MAQARGFAAMSKEKLREVASRGGKNSQAGNGHRWNEEEARRAGVKGGNSLARNRENMVNAGKQRWAKKAS